ncbi:MAG: chitobiase/beta-hexosaminidase C-terminal domain-containing protein [Spirochaetales bacterium]|nr:chitobiase/beta-hexosaminidase C-terminal domain-containing protein [Spirochaetales bacterium]
MMKKILKNVPLFLGLLTVCGCYLFSPGITLEVSTQDRTGTPVFSPLPSFIPEAVAVTIGCTDAAATIYYTTDGTPPHEGDPSTRVYTGPVTVQPGTYLQAFAKKIGRKVSHTAGGYYALTETDIGLGINVTWFNTWNESQPLANVASTVRAIDPAVPMTVDGRGELTGDAGLVVYEGWEPGGNGGGGGAQYGTHHCSFTGQADLDADGATLADVSWDGPSNTTSFTFTTTQPGNSFIHISNTKRLPADPPGTGLRDFRMMRPGHGTGDFLNTAFVDAMEPFSAFRVGPNWGDMMYSTGASVWSERGKPDGLFTAGDNSQDTAPWEVLARMANEMEVDLWICLPPFADEDYWRNIFYVFFYGSDGENPYTSPQADPVWAPLDPDRALYFEVGNEIWNWAYPFGDATAHMQELAEAEIASGDPYHYRHMGDDNLWYGIRGRVARLTQTASRICREVVGDGNMMTRFRPVVAAQASYPFIGGISLSYLKCVYGGHGWYDDWAGNHFPGRYSEDLVTAEDGSLNQFGNPARPLSYWIYGYATAPYVNGASVEELFSELTGAAQSYMDDTIRDAADAGVVPLAYEGGIETYHNYDDPGLDTLIESMLGYWYAHGGGLFMYYALAGNGGSGIYPDLTRQDPDIWPKVRAVRNIAGLP